MRLLLGTLMITSAILGFQLDAVAKCMKVDEIETAQGKLEQRTFRSAGGQPLRAFVLALPAPS